MPDNPITIYDVLTETGLPVAYSHFKTNQAPPYLVYIGSGQNDFGADNTWYHKRNTYQVEYYYLTKDESAEEDIESTLLENGFLYEKSEDIFLEDEEVFVIYYYV